MLKNVIFPKVVVLLFGLFLVQPLLSESVCERALLASEKHYSSNHPNIRLKVTDRALNELSRYELPVSEVEVLLQESQVGSGVMDGRHVIPLFRTVRSDVDYRDYVFLATVSEAFLAGKNTTVKLLSILKLPEKQQRSLFYDMAEDLEIQGKKLKVYGISKEVTIVNVSPAVRTKLNFKHKINMALLESALNNKPDEVTQSDYDVNRINYIYHGDGVKLLVVLAHDQEKNTTSLVTSYFTKDK